MSYIEAKEKYAKYGIDTEKALETLKNVSVSVHCWQGDDVVGFDSKEALSGGIQATGNYPGKATTPAELREDIKKQRIRMIVSTANSRCRYAVSLR